MIKLKIESKVLKDYLKATDIIDYKNNKIQIIGDSLAKGKTDDIEIAREVYEYVRDQVSHSGDINASEVTCKASEVLEKNHGICCAKSHLLAALLRYKGIPTGFCYQKLSDEKNGISYFAVHGLNAAFLASLNKWIRLDARGNKPGVNAQFSIDTEKLAWPVDKDSGEKDIPIVFVNPNKDIVKVLIKSKNRKELGYLWKEKVQFVFDK